MRLLHVAVKCLQVELEFAKVFGLALDDFELWRASCIARARSVYWAFTDGYDEGDVAYG